MNRIIFAMAILVCVSFATSCSPVKRVLKSPLKTKQVAEQYFKQFPVKDSIVYKPGRDTTIIRDSITRDTTRIHTRERGAETIIREIRYLDRLIVDTVSIYERAKLLAMQDVLKYKDSLAHEMLIELRIVKKEKRNLTIGLIVSWVAIILAIIFVIVRKLKIL